MLCVETLKSILLFKHINKNVSRDSVVWFMVNVVAPVAVGSVAGQSTATLRAAVGDATGGISCCVLQQLAVGLPLH